MQSHRLPAVPYCLLFAALVLTQVFQRKEHTDVAIAELISQRYLLSLELPEAGHFWKKLFSSDSVASQAFHRFCFLTQCYLFSKQTKLAGFSIADGITERLDFTVEPEYRNFPKKNFLHVISTSSIYSLGSELHPKAIYPQNQTKLIRCSICRPDYPKTSIFNGQLTSVKYWKQIFLCGIAPSPGIPCALPCHPVLIIPKTSKFTRVWNC